jgi:hypothetical protein
MARVCVAVYVFHLSIVSLHVSSENAKFIAKQIMQSELNEIWWKLKCKWIPKIIQVSFNVSCWISVESKSIGNWKIRFFRDTNKWQKNNKKNAQVDPSSFNKPKSNPLNLYPLRGSRGCEKQTMLQHSSIPIETFEHFSSSIKINTNNDINRIKKAFFIHIFIPILERSPARKSIKANAKCNNCDDNRSKA